MPDPNDFQLVWIKPHSMEPSAFKATEQTLKALRGGGGISPNARGEPHTKNGYVLFEAAHPTFVVWAVKQQGYAADALLYEENL